MPGVLMLEALAQAAALLAFDTLGVTPDDKTVYYFAGIDGARFKRPVEPGDQLMLDVHARPDEVGHLQVQGACDRGRRPGRGGRADLHHAPDCLTGASRSQQRAQHPFHRHRRPRRRDRQHASSSAPIPLSARMCGSAPARRSARIASSRATPRIGRDNRIFQFNSLGAIPQDKKYAGEPCELQIGDRNTIREFCTFNIGSPGRRRCHPGRGRQLDHGLCASGA